MTLGEVIKNYRTNTGQTMETFSEKCNLSKSYISMLESNKSPTGKSITPSIDTVSKIAKATNTTFENLLKILDEDQKQSIYEYSNKSEICLPIKYAQMYSCLDDSDKNEIHAYIEKKYQLYQEYLKEYHRVEKLSRIDNIEDAKILMRNVVAFEGNASNENIIFAANAILQYKRNVDSSNQ